MSPSENPKETALNEAFFDLVESARFLDEGIVTVQSMMTDLSERLTAECHGKTLEECDAKIDAAEEDINDEWPFEGEIATVSGRVYVASEVIESMEGDDDTFSFLIPEEWGREYFHDAAGYYYLVEEALLRSSGIEIIPQYGIDGITIDRVDVLHTFSGPDRASHYTVFTMAPDDTYRHEYEQPTTEEVRARFAARYPEEKIWVDEQLRPNAQASLIERLSQMAAHFQEKIVSDETFREYLDGYVNEEIDFVHKLPYNLVVTSKVDFFTGDNPYVSNTKGGWKAVGIAKDLAFQLFKPRVNFAVNAKGVIYAHIFGETFSEERDQPEYIGADADNIVQFRSTQARHSLATRIILAEQFHNHDTEDDDLKTLGDVSSDESVEVVFSEESGVQQHKEFAETIGFERIAAILDDFSQTVEYAQRRVFESCEDALRESQHLVSELKKQLKDAEFEYGVSIEVSGEHILRPNPVKLSPEFVEAYPELLVIGVDNDNPVIGVEPGDSLVGSTHGIVALTRDVSENSGEEEAFIASPSIVIDIMNHRDDYTALSVQDVRLMGASAEQSAIVPLDTTTSLSIIELEKNYGKNEAFLTLYDTVERDNAVAEYLRDLRRQLSSAESSRYIEIDNLNTLKSVAQFIQESEPKESKATLAVLDALLTHMPVSVEGGAHEYTEDGTLALLSINGVEGDGWRGKVVDIVHRGDLLDGRPSLVIDSGVVGSTVVYMPIDSLTRFAY